jgi:hypothetical protein
MMWHVEWGGNPPVSFFRGLDSEVGDQLANIRNRLGDETFCCGTKLVFF